LKENVTQKSKKNDKKPILEKLASELYFLQKTHVYAKQFLLDKKKPFAISNILNIGQITGKTDQKQN
jgi:hypothetical protein